MMSGILPSPGGGPTTGELVSEAPITLVEPKQEHDNHFQPITSIQVRSKLLVLV